MLTVFCEDEVRHLLKLNACREAHEELGLALKPHDLHLAGIVSEHGYQGQAHWLMFLFEVKPRLTALPPPHREGTFQFFSRAQLASLKLPQTDREQIWPLFWQHRGGFFAAHCRCQVDGANLWTTEETIPGVESQSSSPSKTAPRVRPRTTTRTRGLPATD